MYAITAANVAVIAASNVKNRDLKARHEAAKRGRLFIPSIRVR